MLSKQKQKFEANWQDNKDQFGSTKWEEEIDFLYFIEGVLPLDINQKINDLRDKLFTPEVITTTQKIDMNDFHITIALPGRLGTHFQKNDVKFMQKTLDNILKSAEPIPLEIQNFNTFPNVIFTEAYDPTLRLHSLHETICNEIPFSQHPEYRYQNYLPHVSLFYGGNGNLSEIDRTFESIAFKLDHIVFGKITIDKKTKKPVKTIIKEYHLN